MVFRFSPSIVQQFHSPLILNGLSSQLLAPSISLAQSSAVGQFESSEAVGFQFQPLQATLCVGIFFVFTILQFRINHAVGLNSELVIARREYKQVKVDVMSGLETVERKHFYENQIEELEKSIEASSTLFQFSDNFKVRLRLPIRDTSSVEQKNSDASPTITRIVVGVITILVLTWLLTFLSIRMFS